MVDKIEVGDLVHVELLDDCLYKVDVTDMCEYEYKYSYQGVATYINDGIGKIFKDGGMGKVFVDGMWFKQDGKNITLVRKANHGR